MSSEPSTYSKLGRPFGFFFIALAVIIWICVFVIPFLEYDLLEIAGLMTLLIIIAEISFFIGILLIGKPIWEKYKSSLIEALNNAKK